MAAMAAVVTAVGGLLMCVAERIEFVECACHESEIPSSPRVMTSSCGCRTELFAICSACVCVNGVDVGIFGCKCACVCIELNVISLDATMA